jgi:penicillin amidase
MAARLFKYGLALVALALVAALGGGAWLFFRAMPSYSGRVAMAGLKSEVRVWSDAYAVPHIFAPDMNSAMRALGYLHASERLFQMETQRRAGEGRLAEMLGPELVRVDRFIRTLGFPRLAESSFAALSPDARARLQAYADGVNDRLAANRNRLPPAFLLLGDTPGPWRPVDSLVIGKLLSLQLSHNYKVEMLRARVAASMGLQKAAWFFPDMTLNAPITTEPKADSDHAALDPYEELARWAPFAHGASNEWVISGKRTTTGKPILANDPHLDLSAPILWYLARIVTPEGWVKGVTIPGTPTVLLGQNDRIAWGFTTAMTDTQDLFVETVDPKDPTRYLTPDGSQPFETRQEVIHVKGGADVTLTVRATRHGPVLSDVDASMRAAAGPGKVMALAFSGLGDKDTTFDAVFKLGAARNWDEFLAAMRLFQTPTQNIVFADVDGAIGYVSPGLVPVRKAGDGLSPVDGASGRFDWTGYLPFEKEPQAFNPEAGFLFNANNAVTPVSEEGVFGRDWEEPWRARRIQQFLDSPVKQDLDASAAMQKDHLSLAMLALKPLMASIKPASDRARQALALVAAWDGRTQADAPAPAVAETFLYQLHKALITDKTGVSFDAEAGPLAATATMSLVKEHPEICAPDPDCAATMARALDAALAELAAAQGDDMSKWRWGVVQPALVEHKVYEHVPGLAWWSDLSFPSSGDFYTLDRGGGFDTPKGEPLARTQAGGYRGVFDLADPSRSRFIIATGQSGHIFSPHYRDLQPLWRAGRSITLSGSQDELKARGARLTVFAPG